MSVSAERKGSEAPSLTLFVAVSESNAPCEDRNCFRQGLVQSTELVRGYAVIDGHGGVLAAEQVSTQLLEIIFRRLDEEGLEIGDDSVITKLLNESFHEIDQQILGISLSHMPGNSKNLDGDSTIATAGRRAGACALVLVCIRSRMFFAHVGDCRALLFRSKVAHQSPSSSKMSTLSGSGFHTRDLHLEDLVSRHSTMSTGKKRKSPVGSLGGESYSHIAWGLELIGVTTDHAPANALETVAVKHMTSDANPIRASENDKGMPHAPMRVAGSLAVTRALGDGYLKARSLSIEPYIRFLPYIVCLPTVNIKSIDHVDKYIVLASDGLYNFLSAKEIHSVLREADFKTAARRASIKDGETEDGEEDPDPADMLLQRCLELARHQCGQSKDEFQGLAPGSLRREVVDDITVLVLAIGAP